MMAKKKNKKKFSRDVLRRSILGQYEGEIITLRARVGATSKTTCGVIEPTIELKNLVKDGSTRLLADHLWIKLREIKNPEMMKGLYYKGQITVKGEVYTYYRESRCGNFQNALPKYGIGNIEILKAEELPQTKRIDRWENVA